MSPMHDRDGKIWQDGQLVDWRSATIHVLTHSLHYGMSVFEGVRAYKTQNGTAIFRLPEHTKRLLNSAKIFQMNVPYDMDTLMEAQKEVIRANHLESGYIRPIIWVGSEMLGVSAKKNTIHTAIAAWPWGAYLGDDRHQQGHPCQGLFIQPSPRQRVAGSRQGIRLLHQLDPRQSGSHCRRLRRSPVTRHGRLCFRRFR